MKDLPGVKSHCIRGVKDLLGTVHKILHLSFALKYISNNSSTIIVSFVVSYVLPHFTLKNNGIKWSHFLMFGLWIL